MQPYVLFVNHPKCREMKIKKSGNIKKNKVQKGNDKIITFRCSKTNTSDRITKKTAAGYQKKAFEEESAATNIYQKLKWTQGKV